MMYHAWRRGLTHAKSVALSMLVCDRSRGGGTESVFGMRRQRRRFGRLANWFKPEVDGPDGASDLGIAVQSCDPRQSGVAAAALHDSFSGMPGAA